MNSKGVRIPTVTLALFSLFVLAASAYAGLAFKSPTPRNGGYETVRVESKQAFPNYGDPTSWHAIDGRYPLGKNAPVSGSFGVAYRSGSEFVFEVTMNFHGMDYLHAIVHYPDGKTPRLFVKQGVGALFKEEPIDQKWEPARLFIGFQEKRFL